jgi:hypothetical protein
VPDLWVAGDEGVVHPLLVAAVKAEYIRALEAKDVLKAEKAAPGDAVVKAKAELLRTELYAAHPDFISGALPVRDLLLRMFESKSLVDDALRVVWADERCFDPDVAPRSASFKRLGCVNNAGVADTKPLNIALIGCGQMGHIQALNAAVDPCFAVTWVIDVNQASAEKLAALPAFADAPPHVATDYQTALADDSLDAVLVLTPPSTHTEMSVAALRAGKHVCCEKPMCLSMEDAETMVAVAEEQSAEEGEEGAAPAPVFFLAYPRRFGIDDHKVHALALCAGWHCCCAWRCSPPISMYHIQLQ